MTAWLLTWVSHGVALVAAAAVVLRLVPRLDAATRYVVWFGVLIAIGWPAWISAGPAVAQPIYVPSAPDRALSVFIGVWAAISLLNLARIVPGLHAVYVLRDRCRAFPRHLEARLPLWLEVRGRGRRTELKICDAVSGATVLGFQRPCIAIPSALAGSLTPAELDQIILHEYAHVQRRDDWTRLAQVLALSALWIHPGAHLVSRALQRQREIACDEWVVVRTGLPKAYAKCLARAAEVRGQMRETPALLSAFLGTRNELITRVDRLLTMQCPPPRRLSLSGLSAAVAAIMILAVQLQGVRFAEIADVVLPHVAAAQGQRVQRVHLSQQVQHVRQVRQVRQAFAPHKAQLAPLLTAVVAADAPPMSDLAARRFPGAYGALTTHTAPSAPIAPVAPDAPNRWSSPGVEIASAAKKTSIGVANVFSRAGVSLARTF